VRNGSGGRRGRDWRGHRGNGVNGSGGRVVVWRINVGNGICDM